MNAKERFLAALRFQPVDRPPVTSIATGITVEMMQRSGIFWPEAHHDAHKLAGLAETIWLYTGIECIKLPFCMTIEVEALGARVDFRTVDTLPTEATHPFTHPDELVIPEDFFERGRVPVVLSAITELHKRYSLEVPVVSSIVGPFSLAAKLFGFSNFLVWLITNPEYVHSIMALLTPLAARYANAQVEAGADAITVGEASCSGDLISPHTYRDFIAPYHKKLCSEINAPTILHICGKSTRHTAYIAETGASAYSFDEGVDISVARQFLAGKVALVGYVPTIKVLLNGTPEEVFQASLDCLDGGVDVLNPGCAMAPYTPLENIRMMLRAAEAWRARKHTDSGSVRVE